MKRIFQVGAVLLALCAGMVACGPSEEMNKPTPVTPDKPDPKPDPEQPSTPDEPELACYHVEFRTQNAHNVKMTSIGTYEYELNLSG